MRLVVATEPGVLELNWLWLPTWMGHNSELRKNMEQRLTQSIVGRPMTDDVLDSVHQLVIDYLCEAFPEIKGLRDYLDALKFVRVG